MDYFFRPLGEFFEALFPLVKATGPAFNIFMLITATIASIIWIWKMVQYQKDEVPNR